MKNKIFKLSLRIWLINSIRTKIFENWNIKQKWLGNIGLSKVHKNSYKNLYPLNFSLEISQYLLFLVPIVSLNASRSPLRNPTRETRGSSLLCYNFLRPTIIPNSMVWQTLIFLWHPFDLLCIDKRWILARAFVTNANSMLLQTRFRGRGCWDFLIFPLEFVEFKWSKYHRKRKGFFELSYISLFTFKNVWYHK